MGFFLTFMGPFIEGIFVLIYFQQDTTLHSLFISGQLLYMFRVVSPPITVPLPPCVYPIAVDKYIIIRSTHTYIYSHHT
jgi:hypothetical protein